MDVDKDEKKKKQSSCKKLEISSEITRNEKRPKQFINRSIFIIKLRI